MEDVHAVKYVHIMSVIVKAIHMFNFFFQVYRKAFLYLKWKIAASVPSRSVSSRH